MKRAAYITFWAAATLVVVGLLWQFRTALVMFAFALVVTAAVRPLVDGVTANRRWRTPMLILSYVLILGLLAAIVIAISDSLFFDLQSLSDRLAFTYERIYREFPEGSQMQQSIAQRLPPPDSLYESLAGRGENGGGMLQAVLGVTMDSVAFVAQLVIVLVLSIYWSADRARFERLWLSLLSPESRSRARVMGREIESRVGQYFRSEFVRALAVGMLLGFGLSWMGVPFATLLGVLGGLLSLLPWLGILLMAIPTALAGLTVSPMLAAAGGFFTLLVTVVMERVIQPRIFGRSQYSPMLMVIVAYMLADVFGVTGILLAPPLSAVLQLLYQFMQQPASAPVHVAEATAGDTRQQMEALRGRLEAVRQRIDETEQNGGSEAVSASVLARLEGIVRRTGELTGGDH